MASSRSGSVLLFWLVGSVSLFTFMFGIFCLMGTISGSNSGHERLVYGVWWAALWIVSFLTQRYAGRIARARRSR